VTAASLYSLKGRRDWSRWVTHTQAVQLAVERVLANATDAETAQRGYLLTGRDEYLRPFSAAEAEVARQVEVLAALTRDNQQQQERIAALRPLLISKAEDLERAIELKRRGDPAATGAVQSRDAGNAMDGVRANLARMRNVEERLLSERQARLARADAWSAGVTIGGAALLLCLAVLAAMVVRGDVRAREEQVLQRGRVLEYQERLIAIAGHDLRNPLTAVLVSAQMLLQKREELKPGQANAIDRILRSAARIDALATLLIDFTHARLGKGIPTKPSSMDARAVVERAVDELRAAHPGREIRIESAGAALVGSWDGDRVAQIVSNLVSNAVHYGAADAPVTVAVSRDASDALEIRVHNSGPPVPDELRRNLFEPYQRGQGAESAHPRGLGLGLYIVREIARAHGGDVELRSDAEQGTTFTVRVPSRASAPPEPGGARAPGTAPAGVPAG
jgi:signal transduction histidine kinase